MLLLYFFEVSTNVTLCIGNCYFSKFATVTYFKLSTTVTLCGGKCYYFQYAAVTLQNCQYATVTLQHATVTFYVQATVSLAWRLSQADITENSY